MDKEILKLKKAKHLKRKKDFALLIFINNNKNMFKYLLNSLNNVNLSYNNFILQCIYKDLMVFELEISEKDYFSARKTIYNILKGDSFALNFFGIKLKKNYLSINFYEKNFKKKSEKFEVLEEIFIFIFIIFNLRVYQIQKMIFYSLFLYFRKSII